MESKIFGFDNNLLLLFESSEMHAYRKYNKAETG